MSAAGERENQPTDSRAPWPKSNPTYDEVLRYFVSYGLSASAVSIDLCRWDPGDTSPEAVARQQEYWRNAAEVFHGHDVALLLAELRAVDPERAEKAAERIWGSAEAGDSYGEWLWQWADGLGLPADAICDERRAHLAAERTESTDG